MLAVGELQLNRSLIVNKHGNYKIGAYFHEHKHPSSVEEYNGGVYFAGNQQLTDDTEVFRKIGLSPNETITIISIVLGSNKRMCSNNVRTIIWVWQWPMLALIRTQRWRNDSGVDLSMSAL